MSEVSSVNNNLNTVTNVISGSKVSSAKNGSSFSSCLDKTNGLDDIFERAAKKYNVPVKLLKAVAKAESNFNPDAVSKVGAQGVMQLMPATARELGVVNAFDPEQNIMGGAKYLSALMKKYDGDIKLTLAAYNAGSGNVKKYGGIPPFKETQNYVVKVMKYMNGDITVPAAGKQQRSYNVGQVYSSAYRSTTDSFSYNSSISGSDDSSDQLALIFSYDDYLKLIDMLTEKNEKNKEEDKHNSSIESIITPSYINLLNN